jgi:hypothetical protein
VRGVTQRRCASCADSIEGIAIAGMPGSESRCASFIAFLRITTEPQFNEQVAQTEQGDASPTETLGVASIVFIQKGIQNVRYCSFSIGSSEPALATVDRFTASDHPKQPCHWQ